MSVEAKTAQTFKELNLLAPVLKALDEVGYETPTPIQAATIPLMLDGGDVIGQAQTGTGKTAAFALPLLSTIDLKTTQPQALILAPTRELAIQVAEAFQRYSSHLKGFRVLPVYGGQSYDTQLKQLKRGVHVIVGTPGRVMDHMRRRTLKLDALKCLVLDEADEMLRMGFLEDVEWVLEQTPPDRQIALFSATMPAPIRRIAQKHLNQPREVSTEWRTTAAETIRQMYRVVGNREKLDVLTRILEAQNFDGVIVFVRTKNATGMLTEKLQARGYAAEALNGDMAQSTREKTVERLRKGLLDILVATDVAARGLDVERLSHVVNFDMPSDPESYVHRIGRTGRAGREGEAILFVTPRERYLLRDIERATRQSIEPLEMPSVESINRQRIARFKQQITETLMTQELNLFRRIVTEYQTEFEIDPLEIAAALARIAQGDKPLLLAPEKNRPDRRDRPVGSRRSGRNTDEGKEAFRVEVGRQHGIKPGNLVGAITNEAGLDVSDIGKIKIMNDHSFLDLPADLPDELIKMLKRVKVGGQKLKISRAEAFMPFRDSRGKSGHKKKKIKSRKKSGK